MKLKGTLKQLQSSSRDVSQLCQGSLASIETGTIISQQKRGLFGSFKREPIKFKTSKVLPYSQENFFQTVKDVDAYHKFIPWITASKVLPSTVQETLSGDVKRGKFDGEVKIGFSSLSFAYISHVSYEEPRWILSESCNSLIFENLYSHWEIKKLGSNECEIIYNIHMAFANPLYSSITNHFFDYLSKNINTAFEKRCYELYYKDKNNTTPDSTPKKTDFSDKIKSSNDELSDRKQQQSDNKTHKVILSKPLQQEDDRWIWGIKTSLSNDTAAIDVSQNLTLHKKWNLTLINSVKELQAAGLLTIHIDVDMLSRFLEKSEVLYSELKALYEAFGIMSAPVDDIITYRQSQRVYATHVLKLLSEYGCLSKQTQ